MSQGEMLEQLELEPRLQMALEIIGRVDKKSVSAILNEAVEQYQCGWNCDMIDRGAASGVLFS